MTPPHRSVARRPRVLGLLILTLALAGGLSYQAIDAALDQKVTGEAVLRDYAMFAAEQYSTRVARELEFYGIYPTMQRLRAAALDVAGEVPSRRDLLQDAGQSLEQSLALVHQVYAFDVTSGDFSVGGGETLPESVRDSLIIHARDIYQDDWSSAGVVLSGADSLRTFVYTRAGVSGDGRDLAFGFEVRAAEFRRYFREALRHGPLLPTSLIGEVPNDSVLFVRVSTADGTEVMRTNPESPDPYSTWVSFPMGPRLGDLMARVALLPGMEQALVIGGMPRSRLPLTLLLATLTAVLLVMTMVSWRRERELARLRTEFVSNVSHELRTPLAQIRMFAETLVLDRVRSADERHRALTIIDKEARRLTSLVDNVLHFSRAERRAVDVTPEPTRLDHILSDVVSSFAPLAASHDVKIETDLPPVTAVVDAGAVQQCVLNLLDNAVKYGPEGQTIRLEVFNSGAETVIVVEDQGPGIPEGARDVIWDRFYRLDRDRESVTAGTGIGLAVVRDLVSLQGGRCWVEESGTGARFAMALPLDRRNHAREADEPNRHAG